jgi:ubiquinone/menaquinone biosynthesis C-methylase UbiE
MSFDRLAPHYTWMERALAGPRLQRCRTAWLDALAGCETILIAGGGHGPFLRACARHFPHLEIVNVDASARMLAHAQARARREQLDLGRLKFVHASVPEWRPAEAYFDAVVTNFFLDCFPSDELPAVIATLASGLRPTAHWLNADFAVPARGWARHRARVVHAMMYAFFRPITGIRARCVTEPDELFRAHGFTLARRRVSEWGLLHADWWTRG